MLRVFNTLTDILVWVLVPFVWFAGLFKESIRTGFGDRAGRIPTSTGLPRTMICCASVGEISTAAPFIRAWQRRHADQRLVIATSTPTGRAYARRLFQGEIDVYLRPLELGRCAVRWLNAQNVTCVILMETELWPLFLRECLTRELPVHVINGRISNRSIHRYRKLKKVFAPLLSRFVSLAVQNQTYADRFIELGAAPDRVTVTGNLKFSAIRREPEMPPGLAEVLTPFAQGQIVMIAGSTHKGEETAVLKAFRDLVDHVPNLRLLIAPRHLERLSEVEAEVKSTGLPYARRTMLTAQSAALAMIMILDTHGELSAAYRFGTLAFVGGSLVDIGGHNLLEPIRFGVPVLYGPYIDNFLDEAMLIETSGGGALVADLHTLAIVLHDLIQSPQKLQTMGQAAQKVLDQVQGVLEKTLASVLGE